MGTKNINLPDDLEAYVEAKVASGEYSHFSEVVRDGLRLMMQQEAEKLEWLRKEIAKGIKSADEGRCIEFGDEEFQLFLEGAIRKAQRKAKSKTK